MKNLKNILVKDSFLSIIFKSYYIPMNGQAKHKKSYSSKTIIIRIKLKFDDMKIIYSFKNKWLKQVNRNFYKKI